MNEQDYTKKTGKITSRTRAIQEISRDDKRFKPLSESEQERKMINEIRKSVGVTLEGPGKIMQDAIIFLLARIDGLTSELADADRVSELAKAECERQRSRVDKLEAALRPFSEAGRFFAEVQDETNEKVKVWRRLNNNLLEQLVVGDFLKAREALGETTKEEP